MAPRKSVKTAKTTEDEIEKPPKKRIKKENPKLKSPTVIKVKIPSNYLAKKVQKNARINGKPLPKHTKAKMKQIEFDLTNEVTKCPLVEGNPVIAFIEEGTSDEKAMKKTRKRKKNADIINSEEHVVEGSVECVPVKLQKKKHILKGKLPEPVVESSVECVPVNPQKNKPTLKRKPPEPVVEGSVECVPVKLQKKKHILKGKLPDSVAVQINGSFKNEVPAKPQRKLVLKRNRTDTGTTSNKAEVEREKTLKRSTNQLKTTNSVVRNTRNRAICVLSLEKNTNATIDNNLGNILTNDGQNSSSIIQTTKFKNVKHLNRNNSPIESPISNKSVQSLNSQHTSATSISGCLSWTKDISSSSTTTCVTVSSSDFVRIDGKLPLLQLSDITERKLKDLNEDFKKNGKYSLSNSESSVDESVSLSYCTPEVNSVSQTLNLSTSSSSLKSQDAINSQEDYDGNINNINKIGKALNEFLPKVEKLDLEIMNWIGSANEDKEVEVFQNKVFKRLKEENDTVCDCRKLKSILSDELISDQNGNDVRNEDSQIEIIAQTDFSKATLPEIRNEKHNGDNNCNYATNNDNMMFDDNLNDDDDALSIYADSITDIEPSRGNNVTPCLSNVNPNKIEEYVPEPIHKNTLMQTQSIRYHPTKIQNVTEDQTILQNKNISVCEKQYADSTSKNRETEIQKNIIGSVENNQVANENEKTVLSSWSPSTSVPSLKLKSPHLMVHHYRAVTGQRSVIFHNVCFFNLISNCKKVGCSFPHTQIDIKEVRDKLICLNETRFIQEYMLIRSWPGLRRIYGMCFVVECRRRSLSRILVEMAIDSIIKAKKDSKEDALLRSDVIDTTLLHLNDISLNVCDDLLVYKLADGFLLCDMFMQAIAVTQNFSQFKVVFINLTNFIVRIGRTFHSVVATHILERLCILPFEEHSIRAMIKIIKNTSASIFGNPKMAQFEELLASSDKNCHEEFLSVKNAIDTNQTEPTNLYVVPPFMNQDFNDMNPNTSMYLEREKSQTEPTNLYVVPPFMNQDFNDMNPNTSMYLEREKSQTEPTNLYVVPPFMNQDFNDMNPNTSMYLEREKSQIEPTNLYEVPPFFNQDFNDMNPSTLAYLERKKRYMSPDTTNLDNLNKPPDAPKVTRTVDFNRLHSFSVTMHSKTNSNEVEDYLPRNKFIRNWRFPGRQMVHRERLWASPRPSLGMVRPPRLMNMRHTDVRHVAYGPSPAQNIRKRDPDFM